MHVTAVFQGIGNHDPMKDRIYTDAEMGNVVLRKNIRSRRVSIRVHPVRGVTVTLPYFVPYAEAIRFLRSKKEWVMEVMERQKSASGGAVILSPEEVEALRREAKKYLPGRLAVLAERYGFSYGRLAVKNNRSNWGSCSSKGNINLNLRLMQVPEHLRDYVILHELCHLRHHDHGPAFHALLEQLCTDCFGLQCTAASRSRFPVSRALEKELKTYRLL